MKKLVFVFALFAVLAGCMSEMAASSKSGKDEFASAEDKALLAAVKEGHFVMEALNMQSNLVPFETINGYEVRLEGDKIESVLPYVGEAYVAPMGGDEGLNFTGTILDRKIEVGNKNVKLTLEVRSEHNERYTYFFTVYPGGSTNLEVIPENKQSISFRGESSLRSY